MIHPRVSQAPRHREHMRRLIPPRDGLRLGGNHDNLIIGRLQPDHYHFLYVCAVHSERSQSHQCVTIVFWRRLAGPRRTWEDLDAPMRAGVVLLSLPVSVSLFSISQRLLVRVRKRESEKARERKRARVRKPETERAPTARNVTAAQGLLPSLSPSSRALSAADTATNPCSCGQPRQPTSGQTEKKRSYRGGHVFCPRVFWAVYEASENSPLTHTHT